MENQQVLGLRPVRSEQACSERDRSVATLLLDRVYDAFLRGDVGLPFDALLGSLHGLRSRWDRSSWRLFCGTVCQDHPIRAALREDPFTRRSIDKPRGYAGDAVMLDYVYSGLSEREQAETTRRGRDIFERTAFMSASAKAVRGRKHLLARRIDALAGENPNARVLSVACGHLREALDSSAVRVGKIRELVGVDQDVRSLEVVAHSLAGLPVTPLAASVRDLVAGRVGLRGFDFAYSAGLTDYLDDRTTATLAACLLTALKPGGRLLLANFAPGLVPAAYMEAFMDWRLVYRRESDLMAVSLSLPPTLVARRRTFSDETGLIAYLELTRT